MSKYLRVAKKGENAPITIRIEIDNYVIAIHKDKIIGRFEFVPIDEGSRYDFELF